MMMTGLLEGPLEESARMLIEPVAQRFDGWELDAERALSVTRVRHATIAAGLGVGAGLVAKYVLGKGALVALGMVPVVAIPTLLLLALGGARRT
jgi:hypothetical protein